MRPPSSRSQFLRKNGDFHDGVWWEKRAESCEGVAWVHFDQGCPHQARTFPPCDPPRSNILSSVPLYRCTPGHYCDDCNASVRSLTCSRLRTAFCSGSIPVFSGFVPEKNRRWGKCSTTGPGTGFVVPDFRQGTRYPRLATYYNIIQIWTPIAASESAMMKQQNMTNPINQLTSLYADEVIAFPTP